MPGVRGEAGDQEAFIGAMHNVSAPNADQVIRAVQPLQFQHLLDIGGASGTWTIAFLRACPSAQATLFDLPHVIPMARRRLAAAGLDQRVKLVAGDFTTRCLAAGRGPRLGERHRAPEFPRPEPRPVQPRSLRRWLPAGASPSATS